MCVTRPLRAAAAVWSIFLIGCTREPPSPSVVRANEKIHAVFIAAEDEYHSEESLALLADQARGWGWEVSMRTASPTPATADNIPGLEVLDRADVAIVFMRFRTLPADQVAHLDRYLKRGGAVVGLRTSTHAFAYPPDHALVEWNGFGERVLGAPWIRHFGHDSSTDVTIAPGEERSDLLKDVAAPFHLRSWLYDLEGRFPPDGSKVLLVGQSCDAAGQPARDRPTSAVAWTRTSPWGGKVFATTLGHPEDFQNPSFRALLSNAMRWASDPGAAGRSPPSNPQGP